MQNIYLIILFYIALELFEMQWQRGKTMMEMLAKMFRYYHRNIFLFFMMHPTYYGGIALVLFTDYAAAAVILLLIKTVDIATKILLIQQVFEKRIIAPEIAQMLITPLPKGMAFLGVVVYTPMVYFALTSNIYY